eukprot:2371065-Amphidinium_carterae.1
MSALLPSSLGNSLYYSRKKSKTTLAKTLSPQDNCVQVPNAVRLLSSRTGGFLGHAVLLLGYIGTSDLPFFRSTPAQ